MTSSTETERGFTVVRLIDAPRERVFQAWTVPEQLQKWYGTTMPSSTPTTVDLRVGGAWRLLMIENENKSYMTGGIYREIVAPERLVFTMGAVDGWPELDPARPEDCPIATLTLNDVDGKTEMIFQLDFADSMTDDTVHEWLALGMNDGCNQTLDRLAPYLASISS